MANRTEFLGLDLCGPAWQVLPPGFEAPGGRDPGPAPGVQAGSLDVADWGGRSVRTVAHEAARVRPGPPPLDPIPVIEGPLRRVLEEAVSPFRLKYRNHYPDAPVALAYPARLAPAARRLLPLIVGEPHLGFARAAAGRQNVVGVEAPVALALEAIVDRGPATLPANWLLLTGSGPDGELTVARVEREGGGVQQRLSVRLIRTGAPADAARLAPARDGGEAPWLGHAGAAPDLVASIAGAAAIPPERVVGLPPHAIALGAARFAAMKRKKPLLGLPMREVAVTSACTAPVGLLGVNRHGEGFWRRLAPSGAAIPTEGLVLHSDRPGPAADGYLAFAECLDRAFADAEWLHQDDWPAAGLAWYDLARPARTTPSAKAPRHDWTFRLINRPGPIHLAAWEVAHQATGIDI